MEDYQTAKQELLALAQTMRGRQRRTSDAIELVIATADKAVELQNRVETALRTADKALTDLDNEREAAWESRG